MSDILEEIQELSNKFSNLFEVEGLGNPAVDVPPSQNKIKKDRKTKDGKVEVVSVEDELFPYEGNKREQYRQKILDTINNMIQGTATLEDLLQIVRQKKAPLKEAMELMENLINKRDQHHISKKSVADAEAEFKDSPLRHAQSLERLRFGYNNGKDDRKDVAKYRIGMHDGAKHQVHAYEPEYRCDSDTTPCDRAEETKNRIKRAHAADTLKEAMEVLESVFSQIEKVHGEPVWRNTRVGFVPMNKSAELQDKADKNAYDEFQQARKRENKSEEELDKKRNETKNNPLEEAMDLMEDLFSTILKQPAEKQGSLVYKYHQAKNKENAGKDTYTQAKEEEKRKSKEEKGQEKTEQRKKYRGKSTEDWKQGRLMDQIAKNAANLAKVSDPATAKAIRRNAQKADLKEAMKVLEELIGEGRNLEDVVVRGYDKGKVSLDDLQKLMDKAHEVPSDSSYFHKSKGEKGELSTKRRHMDYERNVLSDGWGKDDNKKIEASIKRKAKNDKSFPVFQALKAYKEGKANIKETLSLTEEIINEVSVKKWKEAAKNSIEGRKEVASDASDRFGEVVYPFRGEVNDPGHKLGNAWDKAEQRADRAEQLAKNLPDSNKSATKLKQAAKKVVDKRDKDNEEAVDKLQGAIDKFKEKPYDERTDKDYSDLAKVQNEWVDKQKKENQARNLVGKPERRPEKNSEGKHKLKEQGFIDRSKEA